jgi:hypothetical protein
MAELYSAALNDGFQVIEAEARQAVARSLSVEFLEGDWFWLPDRKPNGLHTLTRRILSVTSLLDVATVRAGVCRAHRRRHAALVPPESVLCAFYNTNPAFTLDAEHRVRSAAQLDLRTELTRNDRIFVDVLRSSWIGVLDRSSFHEACMVHGMTTHAFRFATTYSAVLDHPAGDLWCLRGTRVSAITAAALRHARVTGPAELRVRAAGT